MLPHGPPVNSPEHVKTSGEHNGDDYSGLITAIESELCVIEGRDEEEAAKSSGRKEIWSRTPRHQIR